MKRFGFLCLLVFFLSIVFLSCQNATPEKCFDVAVLNTNMQAGFASSGMWRQLESPSVVMAKNSSDVVPMKRADVVAQKITFTSENIEKIKALPKTDDNREIIDASLALHQFVLPIYQHEYMDLAKLLDGGAMQAAAEQAARAIQEKYAPRFEMLYNQLTTHGKAYASKHHIQVNWAQ